MDKDRNQEERRRMIDQISRFIKSIDKFNIKKAIIFGSRVKGENFKNSDLDLILIGDDFEKIQFPERASRIYSFYDAWEGEYPLEVFCYTEEEFKKKSLQIGTIAEAYREGIWIDL